MVLSQAKKWAILNWADLTRFAVVTSSVIFTLLFTLQFFVLSPFSWYLVANGFALVVIWLGLMSIYIAFRGPIYSVFAAVLSFLTVVMLLFLYASAYRIFGIADGATHAVTHAPLDCLYFSIVTFTTLGYGDFYPTSSGRLVAASEAVSGYLAFALLVAILGNVWHQLNTKT